MDIKKSAILLLMIFTASCVVAKKKEIITLKEGDPLILLQEKKTALFEIDYSQMMVTDGKDHDNDLSYREWMIVQDEDKDRWTDDWVKKDSVECNKSFRDNFNDEIKKGIKLTKIGKDYKVILRFTMMYLGKHGSVGVGILFGARGLMDTAVASGELEVRDLKSDEVKLILSFNNLIGEEAYSQMARFKGVFENLCEEINEYLEDIQKQQKKQNKKKK